MDEIETLRLNKCVVDLQDRVRELEALVQDLMSRNNDLSEIVDNLTDPDER